QPCAAYALWHSAVSPGYPLSRPTARRPERAHPPSAALRGSGTRTRRRSQPAGAQTARTNIWQPVRRNKRCCTRISRGDQGYESRTAGRREDALFGRHVEIVGERVADHLRVLMNLLGHEVGMVGFVDEKARGRRLRTARSTLLSLPSRTSAQLRVNTTQSPSPR